MCGAAGEREAMNGLGRRSTAPALMALWLIAASSMGHAEAQTPGEPPPGEPQPALSAAAPPLGAAAWPGAVPDAGGGNREISLRHLRTREKLTITYKVKGEYQPEALQKLNWFLRDWHCRKAVEMDPRLIDLLWELHRDLGATGPIRVISAYRSEGYNASLLRAGRRVDPDSLHMQGKAADVIFPGVPLARLKEAAAGRKIGGVGYYPFSGPPFVHVDTGPVRAWDETPPDKSSAVRLPRRKRQRPRLDCELKMADVLQAARAQETAPAGPAGVTQPPVISPLDHGEAHEEGRTPVAQADNQKPPAAPAPAAPPDAKPAGAEKPVSGKEKAPPARRKRRISKPAPLPASGRRTALKCKDLRRKRASARGRRDRRRVRNLYRRHCSKARAMGSSKARAAKAGSKRRAVKARVKRRAKRRARR